MTNREPDIDYKKVAIDTAVVLTGILVRLIINAVINKYDENKKKEGRG